MALTAMNAIDSEFGVRVLLLLGADPNSRYKDDMGGFHSEPKYSTILERAARSGHAEIAGRLIDNGAGITWDNYSPALYYQGIDVIRVFLDKADPALRKDLVRDSIFICAMMVVKDDDRKEKFKQLFNVLIEQYAEQDDLEWVRDKYVEGNEKRLRFYFNRYSLGLERLEYSGFFERKDVIDAFAKGGIIFPTR